MANHHDENTNVVISSSIRASSSKETNWTPTPIRMEGKFVLRRALVFWRLFRKTREDGIHITLSALRVHPDWSETFGRWDLVPNARDVWLDANAFFAGCDFAGFGCNAAVDALVESFRIGDIDLGHELRRRVDTRLLFYHYYPQLIVPSYGNPFKGALRCYGIILSPNVGDVNAQLQADLEMFKVMVGRHKKFPRTVGGVDQFLFPRQRDNWGWQLGER